MFPKGNNRLWLHHVLGLIYFFFNTVALPPPVSYTTMLSVGKVKAVLRRYRFALLAFFGVLVAFAAIHNFHGVVVKDYFVSWSYFVLLLFSGFAAFEYLRTEKIPIDSAFRFLALAAIGLVIIGLISLLTPFADIFWKIHQFVGDGEKVPRFQGLSYEPSHLALTLTPIFLYFFWKVIFRITLPHILYFSAVAVPIALSISFGFVASFAAAIIFTLLIVLLCFGQFKRVLIAPLVIVLVGTIAIALFDNPLSERIEYMLQGKDTSLNGRTWEAFMLGYRCAETENIWFGIGLGQVKYVGEEIIRPYYYAMDPVGFSKENWPVMHIPNSIAETLAIFGAVGVLLKIGFQLYCFAAFRVYQNYFNLSIFSFLFVYQMMGSFILSATEIIMWAFAFSRIFTAFDVPQKVKTMA